MKKSTRIISVLLALITVVGLLPLSLFAASEAKSSTDITKHLDEAGIPEDDIIFASDLNALTNTNLSTTQDANAYFTSNIGGVSDSLTKLYVSHAGKTNGSHLITWKNNEDNKYLSVGTLESAKAVQSYIDLYNRGANSYDTAKSSGLADKVEAEIKEGNKFVFSIDIKLENAAFVDGQQLFTMYSKITGNATKAAALVKLSSDGQLKAINSNTGFFLSADEWTTVSIAVDMSAKKFDIYVNYQLANEGVEFAMDNFDSEHAFIVPTYMRVFHCSSTTTENKHTNGLLFDNPIAYYAPAFVPVQNELHKEIADDGAKNSDIALFTDFEKFSATVKSNFTSATNTFKSNTDGANLFTESYSNYIQFNRGTINSTDKPAFEWVKEADGNNAIKANGYSTQTYIDIVHRINNVQTYNDNIAALEAISKNKTLVFRVDVKAGSNLVNNSAVLGIINMCGRTDAGATWHSVVDIRYGNKLYSSGANLNYEISEESWTTVEVRVNFEDKTYTVYANGTKLKSYAWNKITTPVTGVRMLQSAPALEDTLYLDNIAMYYVDERPAYVNGYKLSLEGNIGVQTFVNVNEKRISDVDNVTAKLTVDGVTTEQSLSEVIYDKDYGYKFECKVGAPQMTSDIKFELYDGDTLMVTDTYSVAEYAKAILDNEDELAQYTKAQPVVKAMLNYGTAAQVQFGVNLDKPANSILTDTNVADNKTAINAAAKSKVTGNAGGISYTTTTLGLESETALYHFFTVNDTDINNYTVARATEAVIIGNTLRVKIAGIEAANLSTEYEVSVTYGGSTIIVTANAMAYAKAVVNSGETSNTLKTLMNALYAYNAAMVAYNG